MKNYKRILACVLAGTMVMGSSLVVLADDGQSSNGNTTGVGELEGTVETDVFSVELPTLADLDTTFDFILDPEGLIQKTDAERYNGATFGEGTLFFANVTEDEDGDPTTSYSNTSDALVVTNKSSIAVDVSLSATVSEYDGITLSEDKSFTDDTSASMYLAIKAGDEDTETAVTASGASVSEEMAAAAEGAYELKWDATANDGDGAYTYKLVANEDLPDDPFATYSFQLTGASNSAGDWSGLAEAAPSVEVVWNVTPHSDLPATPSIVGDDEFVVTSGSSVEVNINLGSGDTAATGISSITYVNSSNATKTVSSSDYTYADGTLTLNASVVNAFVNSSNTTRAYTITFNDAAATTAILTLTKN